jgi:hypothetical protein
MPASDSSGRQTAKEERISRHRPQERCISLPRGIAAGCRSYGSRSRRYQPNGNSVFFCTVRIATLEFTRATPGSRVRASL